MCHNQTRVIEFEFESLPGVPEVLNSKRSARAWEQNGLRFIGRRRGNMHKGDRGLGHPGII